jgi:type II secretory pathway component PulF
MTDKNTKKQLPGIVRFFIKLCQIILYIPIQIIFIPFAIIGIIYGIYKQYLRQLRRSKIGLHSMNPA